jgi:hypothetical protein
MLEAWVRARRVSNGLEGRDLSAKSLIVARKC